MPGSSISGRSPAKNFATWTEWEGEDYVLKARGTIREAVLFGANLVCTRTIAAKMGESRFFIHDVVENEGFTKRPLMYFYHTTIGFPAVDDGSVLVCPSEKWEPRDEESADDAEKAKQFHTPTEGYIEKVYYHDMKPDASGKVHAATINKAHNNGEGFGVYVIYDKEQFPHFIEWKMMGQGEYVVGMEPANCRDSGRDKERAAGRLQYLKPGEVREFDLEVGVLAGPNAIAEFEKKAAV